MFKLRLYTIKTGSRPGYYTGYELNGKIHLVMFLGELGWCIRP